MRAHVSHHRAAIRRNRPRSAASFLAAVLIALLAVVAPAAPAQAAGPAPDRGKPWLGAVLEWGEDTAAGFSDRLGATPALYGHDITMPYRESERNDIGGFLQQTAAKGAHAMLTVKPSVPLDQLGAAEAEAFAAQVRDLTAGFKGQLLVRFAPDMNASWVAWGQQPAAYRQAFQAVSAAFRKDDGGRATMVWAPYLGKDYPFDRNRNAPQPGSDGFSLLDTNGDGTWNGSDSAYAPYYPGDDAVDWVGLAAYHDDTAGAAAVNSLPHAGELEDMLTASGNENFYGTYAEGHKKPFLLQTSAFYSPASGGAPEADIKTRWWDQVVATATSPHFAGTAAVVWDERTSTRDTGVASISWLLTGSPDIAKTALDRLKASPMVTGPVTDVASAGTYVRANTLAGAAPWTVAAAMVILLVALWQVPRRINAATAWSYQDPSARDSRVDLLRGMAIVFVVVNHLGMASLFQLLTQEAVGFVSGAELFVLFSGLVVGMVYGPKAKEDFGRVVDLTSRRAGKLYVTALAVLVGVFLLSLLPFFHTEALTTFVDQGTGGAGHSGAGRTYDLYAGMSSLFQFPVPPQVLPAIVLLQFGPWQFNVMGLYVVLLLASPLILAALNRGKAIWVLLASLAVYAVGAVTRVRLLPSQFEDSFPLLVWQVLFVVGLVVGYHRRSIVAWLSAHTWVVAACTAAAFALAFLSWGNPYLANNYDVRLALMPDAAYRAMYDALFGRTYVAPGRLLNVLVLVVAAYAFLSAYWKPVQRALGWFLIPLGRATLYVFIMHVVLIAVVANIPALQQQSIFLNTVAYAVVLGLLWVMVRARFLFRIIPT
ncbi:OpgC domain-containing protein [Pseudarthrobacter sp. NIBRBAC000502770]|uniref:OpgC domain-containing protein n=1 Tax=Pseudarthrobacter sp. NIBRBAC000502770 TaxID=2590785 RepID=UPI001140860B|nr:OpgC domain-containing protein [Pseudarthrobacter sp. NIBRBAC000502770]QDG89898.1 OpgC domain-containing protein [Pseudarthrobacter sp. NIBRBAC000502770]